MKARAILLFFSVSTLLLWRCGNHTETASPIDCNPSQEGIVTKKISGFSTDNAYDNIKKQLDFSFFERTEKKESNFSFRNGNQSPSKNIKNTFNKDIKNKKTFDEEWGFEI